MSAKPKERARAADEDHENGENEEEEHCPKRLRCIEPDVNIIVGGQTFLHYSMILSNASKYFDAMFSSNMKEARTKEVEWPEKDPEEWKQVYEFIGDPASVTLNEKNVETFVPWFSELRMVGWLKRADEILLSGLVQERDKFGTAGIYGTSWTIAARSRNLLNKVLKSLECSLRFSLVYASKEGLKLLANHLWCFKLVFDQQSIGRLVSILKDEDAQKHLMSQVKALLPTCTPDMEPVALANNPLIEPMLVLRVHSSLPDPCD